MQRTIQRALISVFHKEGLAPIVEKLQAHGVEILSTGGTQKAIEALGAKVTLVEIRDADGRNAGWTGEDAAPHGLWRHPVPPWIRPG